jgi:hypothetical protein
MAVAFTKISGVIIVTGTGTPLYFFGTPKGSFTAGNDGVTVLINIEGQQSFQIAYTELRFGPTSQIPSSLTTALTLLHSIFGS